MTGTLPARVFSMIAGVIVLSGCLSSDDKKTARELEPLHALTPATFNNHEDVLLLMPTSLYDRTYAEVQKLISLPNIEPIFTTNNCESGHVDSRRYEGIRTASFANNRQLFDIGESWLRNCENSGSDMIFGASNMDGYREIGYAVGHSNPYYAYEISGEGDEPFIAHTSFFTHQRFYNGDIEVTMHDEGYTAEGRKRIFELANFVSFGTVYHSQLGKPDQRIEYQFVEYYEDPDDWDPLVSETYKGFIGAVFRSTNSIASCTNGLIFAETLTPLVTRPWEDDDEANDMGMSMNREVLSGRLELTDANQVTAEVEFNGTTITVTFLGEEEVFTYQEYADLVMSQCLGF